MLGRNRQNKPNGFCSCCVLRSGAQIVLLTRTDETNDASGIVSISSNHGNFSAGLYIKQGSSPAFLQQLLAIESFHSFAFPGTDGEGTSPPPCSKLLVQYVCRYTSSLFHARRNVTLRRVQSLFLSMMVFFI